MIVETDMSHFVPAAKVPRLPVFTTAGTAYGVLAEQTRGGLIAEEGDVPLRYVTARFLKAAIEELARQDQSIAAATLAPLTACLWHFYSHSSPLRELIRNRSGGDIAVVPIANEVLVGAGAAPLQTPEYKVYRVQDHPGGQLRGWYFNHEPLRETIETAPEQWMCDNGHPNADPDSGWCRFCSGGIKY